MFPKVHFFLPIDWIIVFIIYIYIDVIGFVMKLQGGWEIDESLKDAALRETFEEAGVLGDVDVQVTKWFFGMVHVVDSN